MTILFLAVVVVVVAVAEELDQHSDCSEGVLVREPAEVPWGLELVEIPYFVVAIVAVPAWVVELVRWGPVYCSSSVCRHSVQCRSCG
jgi:hypothetical protein